MSLKLHDNVHSLAHKRTKRIEECFRQMRAAAAADKKDGGGVTLNGSLGIPRMP